MATGNLVDVTAAYEFSSPWVRRLLVFQVTYHWMIILFQEQTCNPLSGLYQAAFHAVPN